MPLGGGEVVIVQGWKCAGMTAYQLQNSFVTFVSLCSTMSVTQKQLWSQMGGLQVSFTRLVLQRVN